jgi:hypothetical protein
MNALSNALARVAEIQEAIRKVESMERSALELWLRTTPGDEIDGAYRVCRDNLEAIKAGLQGELVTVRMGALL